MNLLALLCGLLDVPQLPATMTPSRPVATYSIVARDSASGELGVAVQSHWFAVGAVVPWAEAGVGVVATQSFVEVSYGPLGLAAMRRGEIPTAALAALLAKDENPAVRQVAFVDARGRVAAHTGDRCIAGAGHRTGDGFSVQANLMWTADVPQAMADAFTSSTGPLAERLLRALQAAQRAGGDVRGKQSAALVVVRGKASEKPWTDRLVDLRVDDDPDPLAELDRLLRLHRAYERMNAGDEAMARSDVEQAVADYRAAEELFPDNDEFIFWHGVSLAAAGQVDRSLALFERAFRLNPSWILLVPRLVEAGHLPATPGLAEKILGVGAKLAPAPTRR